MSDLVDSHSIVVVGAGLAGSECAMMIARLGHQVLLHEMRPNVMTPAHQTSNFAEIVCSNSLGSVDPESAPGLLKQEMQLLGSIVLEAGYQNQIPAGKALGVDREGFSKFITAAIHEQPLIKVVQDEVKVIPQSLCVIATGPLTSKSLADDLSQRLGQDSLYFYDSISPIVDASTIDMNEVFYANRYEEGKDDYLNCPMDRITYEKFVQEIIDSEKVPSHAFESIKCFEACLPIEVMAARGLQTLAFGPMKPVGLKDPRTGKQPYAVVQLRRENMPTTMFNMVGFQTRMKWPEQKRIFKMIPGLNNAQFIRLGSMHRNTYLESPKHLNKYLSLKDHPNVHFAGQITGVEGYVESSAIGQWAGLCLVAKLRGLQIPYPPHTTALGALLRVITTMPLSGQFSPMNINFGLFDQPVQKNKDLRRKMILKQARNDFDEFRIQLGSLFKMNEWLRPRLEEQLHLNEVQ